MSMMHQITQDGKEILSEGSFEDMYVCLTARGNIPSKTLTA